MNPSKTSDAISQALDLTPLTQTLPAVSKTDTQTSDDFEFARGNMLNTIMKGQEALDGILEVAAMSQHPRSFEVAAKIIDSLTNANKSLLDLTKTRKDIDGTSGGPQTVNNNLFVGSTAELQKFLKQQNEQE
jgi:FtsZ-interacting cell division protein YlmF